MKSTTLPQPEDALPGRTTIMPVSNKHYVTGKPIYAPFPAHLQTIIFALGCFWGAEKKFWQCPGVYSTAVGYCAGFTPNPTYDELCSGLTGHAEAVLIIFDPKTITFAKLLEIFWESHNPTQGMRQGNDCGTQYRSGIYTFNDAQQEQALASKKHYQERLSKASFPKITTEIRPAPIFYYAEDHHQAYLAKNPSGYCGLGGIGVNFADNSDDKK